MFLRRCERRKSGKRHTYWALVESYRTARGSRQRVVAYLGDLTPSERDGWAKLGAHLERARVRDHGDGFRPESHANGPLARRALRMRGRLRRDVARERDVASRELLVYGDARVEVGHRALDSLEARRDARNGLLHFFGGETASFWSSFLLCGTPKRRPKKRCFVFFGGSFQKAPRS